MPPPAPVPMDVTINPKDGPETFLEAVTGSHLDGDKMILMWPGGSGIFLLEPGTHVYFEEK